jgi:AcrR family transcriptional regulator
MLVTENSVQKMTQNAKTQPDNRLSREPRDDAKPARRLRQVERTQATRTALLASAERIFARDGFEAARIEDIALDAGRTRGAFYANFDGKAEIFIALRSITFRRLRSEVSALLANVRGKKARERRVALYLLEQIHDSQSLLLQLEFKLFAIRHPEMRAELAKRHLDAQTPDKMEELAEELRVDENAPLEQLRRGLAIEALLEGFAVSALFSPEVMDRDVLAQTIPPLASILLSDWLRGSRS